MKKSKGGYYELCRTYRSKEAGKKTKTQYICYLGQLSELEKIKLSLILKAKTSSDLSGITFQTGKEQQNGQQSIQKQRQNQKLVTLTEVRPNVFKKVIDKAWLTQTYQIERINISAIAALLSIHRDRVREHLEEHGIIKKGQSLEQHRLSTSSSSHIEFGWIIVDGKKIRDVVEFEIIKKIAVWREDGVSFQGIADKLTEMGIRGRLGADKWDRGVVRRILLRNQKYL